MVLINQVVLVLVSSALLACGSVDSSNAEEDIGKEVYTTYCVACHGGDGKLKLNDAPDLTFSKMTLDERIENIGNGGSIMPAFSEVISKEEIEAVAAYLDELKEQD